MGGASVPTVTRTHAVIDSPVDPLTAVRDDGVLVGLYFSLPGRDPDPARLGRRDDAGFADVAACTATSAPSSAAGTNSTTRVTHGRSTHAAGTDRPASFSR